MGEHVFYCRSVIWISNRMMKKSAGFVLASLRGSTYDREYDSPLRLLRPRPRNGASWCAGVGWVISTAILSILYGRVLLSHMPMFVMV